MYAQVHLLSHLAIFPKNLSTGQPSFNRTPNGLHYIVWALSDPTLLPITMQSLRLYFGAASTMQSWKWANRMSPWTAQKLSLSLIHSMLLAATPIKPPFGLPKNLNHTMTRGCIVPQTYTEISQLLSLHCLWKLWNHVSRDSISYHCIVPRNCIDFIGRPPSWLALLSLWELHRSDWKSPYCPALHSSQKLCRKFLSDTTS